MNTICGIDEHKIIDQLKVLGLHCISSCRVDHPEELVIDDFSFTLYWSDWGGESLYINLIKPEGIRKQIYSSGFENHFTHGAWSYSFFMVLQEIKTKSREVSEKVERELKIKQEAEDLKIKHYFEDKYRENSW